MTIIRGLVNGKFHFPDFNLEYQIEKHVAMALKQWPKLDPNQERRLTRQRLITGNAWLWPEPMQMRLFE